MHSINESNGLTHVKAEDIGLADVLSWLNRNKWILLAFTLLAAVAAGVTSYFISPTYESRAVLQPVQKDDGSPGMSGGLSSLAGAVLGGGGGTADDTTVTLALLRSNRVILDFIRDENLLPDLYPSLWDENTKSWKQGKQPSLERAAQSFARKVTAVKDKEGLIALTAEWNSAEKAQAIVLKYIERINTLRRDKDRAESERKLAYLYARLREEPTQELRNTISAMIAQEMRTVMRADSPSDYSLKVIDPPLVPEFRASPKRKLLVMAGAIFGLLIGVLSLLVRQTLRSGK